MTAAQWDEIQSLRESGHTPRTVSEMFPDVSVGQVKNVWNGSKKRPGWIHERARQRNEQKEIEQLKANGRAKRCELSTVEQVDLFHAQNDVCYLCEEPLDFDLAHIDHDHSHETCQGHGCKVCVRGLTHNQCNTGIGLFGENPERMRRVADNLERMLAAKSS